MILFSTYRVSGLLSGRLQASTKSPKNRTGKRSAGRKNSTTQVTRIPPNEGEKRRYY